MVRPSSTSRRTGPGGSDGCTATRRSRPSRRARPTVTTTCSAIRSIRMSGAAPSASRRCTRRMQELGCVFGAKNGWERAEFFEPGKPWRRAGADQRAFGWTRPPWFGRLGAGARRVPGACRPDRPHLVREDRGRVGPARSPCSSASATTGSTDRSAAIVYTQFLNRRGGIVADVTVTRLGDDRFRVTTGSATVDADLGWIRHARSTGGRTGRASRGERRTRGDRVVGAARARGAGGRHRRRRLERGVPLT